MLGPVVFSSQSDETTCRTLKRVGYTKHRLKPKSRDKKKSLKAYRAKLSCRFCSLSNSRTDLEPGSIRRTRKEP